jgi:ethanolamine utilization protein EutS
MDTRLTGEEMLIRIFGDRRPNYSEGRHRYTRVRIPGKEVSLAHIIRSGEESIYRNLGLHIGVHEGENHTGESLGLLQFTPWECVVLAADMAVKSGDVEIGFMDRFCGQVILTGGYAEVRSAVEGILAFFRDELGITICALTEQ